MQALEGLGLLPRVPVATRDFADPAVRAAWIRDKHMQVLSFYDPRHPAREVDVFVAYPLDFEQLVQDAVPTRVGAVTVPVARPTARAGRGLMSSDPWARGTFAGTEAAQAAVIAALTAEERLVLLEELLEIARASGALARSREAKQAALDKLWGRAAGDHEG